MTDGGCRGSVRTDSPAGRRRCDRADDQCDWYPRTLMSHALSEPGRSSCRLVLGGLTCRHVMAAPQTAFGGTCASNLCDYPGDADDRGLRPEDVGFPRPRPELVPPATMIALDRGRRRTSAALPVRGTWTGLPATTVNVDPQTQTGKDRVTIRRDPRPGGRASAGDVEIDETRCGSAPTRRLWARNRTARALSRSQRRGWNLGDDLKPTVPENVHGLDDRDGEGLTPASTPATPVDDAQMEAEQGPVSSISWHVKHVPDQDRVPDALLC